MLGEEHHESSFVVAKKGCKGAKGRIWRQLGSPGCSQVSLRGVRVIFFPSNSPQMGSQCSQEGEAGTGVGAQGEDGRARLQAGLELLAPQVLEKEHSRAFWEALPGRCAHPNPGYRHGVGTPANPGFWSRNHRIQTGRALKSHPAGKPPPSPGSPSPIHLLLAHGSAGFSCSLSTPSVPHPPQQSLSNRCRGF